MAKCYQTRNIFGQLLMAPHERSGDCIDDGKYGTHPRDCKGQGYVCTAHDYQPDEFLAWVEEVRHGNLQKPTS